MAGTRSGNTPKTSPNVKDSGKRAAKDNASSPAAKRTKTSNNNSGEDDSKLQQTIEDTMQGIEKVEDDSSIKEQIDSDEKLAKKLSSEQTETPAQEDDKAKALKEAEAKVAQLKKEQKEESSSNGNATQSQTSNGAKDSESNQTSDPQNSLEASDPTVGSNNQNGSKPDQQNDSKSDEKNAFNEVKADEAEVKKDADKEGEAKAEEIANNDDSVVADSNRKEAMPSSILEKGVIYFFFRGRVGTENDGTQGVEDVARSYIVLRPIPLGSKLGDGPLEDSGNARLLALPKKILPQTTNDKFLMFVDKTKCTIKDLKDQFASNSYSTRTVGTSTTPAVTPIAEGIYAITSTAGASHLAYKLSIPEELGSVQKDLGLNNQGSFVLSVKNPTAPGPANATLDNPADYPESLQSEFGGRRWCPLKPAFLDYTATQFLIIGEGVDGGFGNAVNEMEKDKGDEAKISPEEEMEKLEEENSERVEGLKGDDAVFADLGLSAKEYPKMKSSW